MVNTRTQTNRVDGADASITDPGNANANVEQVPTQLEMFTQMREMQARLRRAEEELREVREEREVSSYRSGRSAGNYSDSRGRSRHHSEASPTSSRAPTVGEHSAATARVEPVTTPVNVLPSKHYKSFLACKPVEFHGGHDPVVNIRWLKEMEGIFQASECPESMKVIFAARVLKEVALDWWETTRDSLGQDVIDIMTWDMFKVRFMNEYCTVRDQQMLEKEFLALKMGDRSIHVYAKVFMEKLKFVGHMFPTEQARIARYVEGLPPSYRGFCRRCTTLADAIQESKLVDDDQKCEKELEKKDGTKRKSDEASESSKKLKGSTQGKNDSKDQEAMWCDRCKSKHAGECSASTQKCLNCRKMGHIRRDCKEGPRCYNCQEMGHISAMCPSKRVGEKKSDPKDKSHAFQMTAEENDDA